MWGKRFTRRVHPSWCVAWFSMGVICGIAGVGYGLNVASSSAFMTALALLFFVFACVGRRATFIVFAFVGGIFLGIGRAHTTQKGLAAYDAYYGKAVTVLAVVNEDVAYGPDGDQRVLLRDVQIKNSRLPGIVWVTFPQKVEVKRGDMVTMDGRLVKGFGNFPAILTNAQLTKIEHPVPGDVARRVRDWFAEGIRRSIPEPEASLSVGYLIGQRRALPESLNQQLQLAGLTHAVVASGYNLTILVGFARRMFLKHSKYLAALSASGMIASFVLITGFSPSMTRAGLVSLLSVAAWYYGRSIHPAVLLPFAAAITAIWRPSYVWGDVGWYLSFSAFSGVILVAPLLKRYFFGTHARLGVLRETLIETLSAQLLTLPIILYSFGQYATYALLANVLVLPLVPLAMLLTFVAGVGGVTVPSVAWLFGYPAKLLLLINIYTIGWVANLPGAAGEAEFGVVALVSSYLFIIATVLYMQKVTKFNFHKQYEINKSVF